MNEPYKALSAISYNALNRTDMISFSSSANRYIKYAYNASGILIRKQQYDNVGGVATLQTTTDYIDDFVFTTAGAGTAALQYFNMPEGRVLNNAGTLSQEFTIADQQGNVRIAFDNTGTGGTAKTRQENSYYAFGMIMPGSVVPIPGNQNRNLYNGGSEWQNDYGNLPDYYQTFYRNYDAALGRFVGVDPEGESAESMTVYQYAENSPVMMNDPMGDFASAAPSVPFAFNEFARANAAADAYDNELVFGGVNSWSGTTLFDSGGGGSYTSASDALGFLGFHNVGSQAGLTTFLDPSGKVISTMPSYDGSTNYEQIEYDNKDVYRTTSHWNVLSTEAGLALANNSGSHDFISFNGITNANQGGYAIGFKQYVAVILGEARERNPVLLESAALGGTIINRLNDSKSSLHDPNWVNKAGTPSAYNGMDTKRYADAMKMSIDAIAAKYPTQFAGALLAYNNWGKDYSGNPNRSYYWTAAGLTGKFYAYQQYLQGNMVRNTIGGTTFYSFTNPNWSWK